MSTTRPFEIGLFTFGEITADPVTGSPIDPAIRLREFIESDPASSEVLGNSGGKPGDSGPLDVDYAHGR